MDGLESLSNVFEDLIIRNNVSLGNLDGLANLAQLSQKLTITGNTSLPASAAQALADRLVEGGYEGEVTIEDNAAE